MTTSKSTLGKRSRAAGRAFELKVRHDFEDKGWTVCKWTNTVDLENNRIIQAKSKYNPFLKRTVSEGSGFPDFLAFRKLEGPAYAVIGIESKKSKYLDQKEKKMIKWYKDHNIFSDIFVAYQKKFKNKNFILCLKL